MKTVVTAIGNPILNIKLKQEKELNIIGNDIQYQEGIFELLEENNIEFLILSEMIQGEFTVQKVIEKIKLMNQNIKIILILEHKKEELENVLIAKGIFKILYNNQIEIEELIRIIMGEEKNSEKEDLQREIKYLKKLMSENQKTENKFIPQQEKSLQIVKETSLLQKIMMVYYRKQYKRQNEKKEVISISGPSGVRKKYHIS